jgi:MFS superfamily sulfate permease-like transporter
VLLTSFVLTMVIPLQYAVLAAVGLSVILHVVRQSNQVTIKCWLLDPDGNLIETGPPAQLPTNEVVALEPYGSLFFAAAPVLESQLPAIGGADRNSVVILRLRDTPTSAPRSWTSCTAMPRPSWRPAASSSSSRPVNASKNSSASPASPT